MLGFHIMTRLSHIARKWAVFLALAALLLVAVPLEALQGASPSLRPYWHVFAAYAIMWGLVLLWLVSIVRRLSRVEARLEGRNP